MSSPSLHHTHNIQSPALPTATASLLVKFRLHQPAAAYASMTRCGGVAAEESGAESVSFFIEHSIQMRSSLVSDVVVVIEARKVKMEANSNFRGVQLSKILPIGSDFEYSSVTLQFYKQTWTTGTHQGLEASQPMTADHVSLATPPPFPPPIRIFDHFIGQATHKNPFTAQ